MKKIVKISLVIILLFSLLSCQKKLEKHSETTINAGFDTMFQLIGYTETKEEFDKYFQLMTDEALRMHKLFDIYHTYDDINNIKTINDQAGIAPVVVDDEIINLLLASQKYNEKTQGLFDVTLGSVLQIWHDYRENGKALNREGKYGPSPSLQELEEAANHTGHTVLEIDRESNTVYLNDPKASLDVGAIAKGYAVEVIALRLEQEGLQHGIVNGGGNIRTINLKPDDDSFKVGITNPDDISGPSILNVSLDQSMSIVTSGDYERFFIDDQGNHQHHIINPNTLFPTQGVRSVTIVYPDSGVADILSTVFTIASLKEAENILQEFDDLGVIWVYDKPQETNFPLIKKGNHYIYHTENLGDYINQ